MLKQGQLKQGLMKKRNQAQHVKKAGPQGAAKEDDKEDGLQNGNSSDGEVVEKEEQPFLANQFWKVEQEINLDDLLSDYE